MGKILFANNARRMHGLPLRRKKDNRKRYLTRNVSDEEIDALLDYLEDRRYKKYDIKNEGTRPANESILQIGS